MPMFFVEYLDKPDMGATRARYDSEHQKYLAARADIVKVAGPLGEHGETVGALIILKCASLADASDFLKGDPLSGRGLFESVLTREFQVETGAI